MTIGAKWMVVDDVMDNSSNEPARPIKAGDYDTFSGIWYWVCPSCHCVIDHKENPCSICQQQIVWEKKKAARQ